MRHPIIEEDLQIIAAEPIPWDTLMGKHILVTGANGMLPSYMVETLLYLNETLYPQKVKVTALVRNQEAARDRFAHYQGRDDLDILVQDVCQPLQLEGSLDLIIHAASQASPKYYQTDPVNTLKANIIGTYNLLELAVKKQGSHVHFFSSGSVYGKPTSAPIREDTFEGINPLDVRACYAESKRMGETLCASYGRQYNLPVTIVRPFHTYGPGMKLNDGRIFADLVNDVVNQRPIQLNSNGEARRAFCYISDAIRAFFTVILLGEHGQAYNVANPTAESSMLELAQLLVETYPEKALSVQVKNAHSTLADNSSRSHVDISKLTQLGWKPTIDLQTGFKRTIDSFTPPAYTTR